MWGFFAWKKDGVLVTNEESPGFESRKSDVQQLMRWADQLYNFPDFEKIFVGTNDFPSSVDAVYPCFPQSDPRRAAFACPDFLFAGVPPVIRDYEETRLAMEVAGDLPPETDLVGWRGNADVHPNRRLLLDTFVDQGDLFDFRHVNPHDPNQVMSLQDQTRRFRYLLDVEGRGYSARLKLLLFSGRVTFVVDRPYVEFYHFQLEPWVHFVPVKRDFSDLIANVKVLKNDPELEKRIARAARAFAMRHLTRDACLERWNQVIHNVNSRFVNRRKNKWGYR